MFFCYSIPQYVEVPPIVEAKRINLYFAAVLFYHSNHLFLKDESKLIIFLLLLAGYLLLILHYSDPVIIRNEKGDVL